jgi:hypothetical protein
VFKPNHKPRAVICNSCPGVNTPTGRTLEGGCPEGNLEA